MVSLLYSLSGIDYEQYYASLAASNAASTQATPSGLGSEDLEEEEESKHAFQRLETLDGYRKRSRSQEDEGAAAKKLAKLESEPPDISRVGQPEAETDRGDDPLVSGMGHELHGLLYAAANLLFISEWRAETVLGGHRRGPGAHDTR